MKRRQREKRASSRPATRAEAHKSPNPFGSNLDTPGKSVNKTHDVKAFEL